jgi:hypothetical protein
MGRARACGKKGPAFYPGQASSSSSSRGCRVTKPRRHVSISDLAALTGLSPGWLRQRLLATGRIVPERVAKELLLDRAEALRVIADPKARATAPSAVLPTLDEYAAERGIDPIETHHVLNPHRAVFRIGAAIRVDRLLADLILGRRQGGHTHATT